MNYRVYILEPKRNDQLGATLRLVVLSGTLSFSAWNYYLMNSFGDMRRNIQQTLEYNGFIVNAVNLTQGNGYNVNIELQLSVYDNFSAEEARNNASRVLSQMRAAGGGFDDVNLKVVSDYKTTTTANNFPRTTTQTKTSSSNSSSNSNYQAQSPIDFISTSLNPTTLFGTTGVTVGVAAAILALVVILKR